jgi:hypothetical protein
VPKIQENSLKSENFQIFTRLKIKKKFFLQKPRKCQNGSEWFYKVHWCVDTTPICTLLDKRSHESYNLPNIHDIPKSGEDDKFQILSIYLKVDYMTFPTSIDR